MGEETSLIQIKGIKEGLLVTLGDAGWTVLQQALLERIEQQPAFFQGARMVIDVGNQALKSAELSQLRDRLSDHGIMLWTVLSNSPLTEKTAQILGLGTKLPKPRQVEKSQSSRSSDDEHAMWVNKTLRSGMRVEFAGHIIIFGDVNPGAEVVAGGSVIVWGRLRGVVHAGAQGNRNAVVCALDLFPTQLRIADEIAVTPARSGKAQPEIVRIKDGQLQAEVWTQS